jgi:two-component system sensor histidine kinase KdpD
LSRQARQAVIGVAAQSSGIGFCLLFEDRGCKRRNDPMPKAHMRVDRDSRWLAASEPLPHHAQSAAAAAFGYLAAIVMTALATLVAIGLDSGITIPNISLIFVVPVIGAGIGFGLGPSVAAALLGAVSYNFFFTAPRYSLTVTDPANIWAIALLLVVGGVVSTIAYTARRRAADDANLKQQIGVLRGYGRDVAAAADAAEIVSLTSQALTSVFQVPAAVMLMTKEDVVLLRSVGRPQPKAAEFEAARASLASGVVIRARTFPALDSRFDFWPVPSALNAGVVIGLAFDGNARPVMQDELVDIVRGSLALALDRLHFRLDGKTRS